MLQTCVDVSQEGHFKKGPCFLKVGQSGEKVSPKISVGPGNSASHPEISTVSLRALLQDATSRSTSRDISVMQRAFFDALFVWDSACFLPKKHLSRPRPWLQLGEVYVRRAGSRASVPSAGCGDHKNYTSRVESLLETLCAWELISDLLLVNGHIIHPSALSLPVAASLSLFIIAYLLSRRREKNGTSCRVSFSQKH